MKVPESNLDQKIKNIVAIFFEEQLRQYPSSIKVVFWDEMCIVKAMDALPPGEAICAGSTMFVKEAKTRQFEGVMSLLKKEVENAAGTKTLSIDFFIGNNNTQFLIITFREDLQNSYN